MLKNTKQDEYADRLVNLSGAKWKTLLDVQRPYRWNMNRLNLGRVLDVGCGIGRNLKNLPKGSVGVDHNILAVKVAKENGLEAYTQDEFIKKKYKKQSFDSMLLAHVLEHMSTENGKKVVLQYLPYVKNKVVVICPQEKGFTTDETHVNFLDGKDIEKILRNLGLKIIKVYSFPFPRVFGKFFKYNETIVIAKKSNNYFNLLSN